MEIKYISILYRMSRVQSFGERRRGERQIAALAASGGAEPSRHSSRKSFRIPGLPALEKSPVRGIGGGIKTDAKSALKSRIFHSDELPPHMLPRTCLIVQSRVFDEDCGPVGLASLLKATQDRECWVSICSGALISSGREAVTIFP